MNRRISLFALLACVASPALANQVPLAGKADARMRTVVYDPNQVVRLSTNIGGALVVSFSPSERITAVVVSNSKDLMANPRENFLFMKSKTVLPPQPVIVLTSGSRGTRRYVFEVQSGLTPTAVTRPEIYYSVEFVYPGDEAAEHAAMMRRQRAQAATRELSRALNGGGAGTSVTPRPKRAVTRNWRYIARGSRVLEPAEVYDDGFSTTFRFRGNSRIPSIYRINSDGREAAANMAVRGEYVVVGSVAPGWRLRDGMSTLYVWNRNYDRIGRTTGTHTISPRVRRITKELPR